MYETAEDLTRLQAVLDESIERAGSFLRRSFEMPEHSLSAAQLARTLEGVQTVALATVTASGEPRVAPTGALFYRGQFCIPTVATAARTRHIQKRPAVSLTVFWDTGLAVIVHGRAAVLASDSPEFGALEALQRYYSGTSARDWGEGVYLRVAADRIYTYTRDPERASAAGRSATQE